MIVQACAPLSYENRDIPQENSIEYRMTLGECFSLSSDPLGHPAVFEGEYRMTLGVPLLPSYDISRGLSLLGPGFV